MTSPATQVVNLFQHLLEHNEYSNKADNFIVDIVKNTIMENIDKLENLDDLKDLFIEGLNKASLKVKQNTKKTLRTLVEENDNLRPRYPFTPNDVVVALYNGYMIVSNNGLIRTVEYMNGKQNIKKLGLQMSADNKLEQFNTKLVLCVLASSNNFMINNDYYDCVKIKQQTVAVPYLELDGKHVFDN